MFLLYDAAVKNNLPTPEQWKLIQGGKPILIADEPANIFKVCHVYNEGDDITQFNPDLAAKYPHHGAIVTSTVRDLNRSLRDSTGIFLGAQRTQVNAPPALRYDLHGLPCTNRSGGRGYPAARSRAEWTQYLQERAHEQWDLWDIDDSGSTLRLVNRGLISTLLA